MCGDESLGGLGKEFAFLTSSQVRFAWSSKDLMMYIYVHVLLYVFLYILWLPFHCPPPDYPFWQLKPAPHRFPRILAYLWSPFSRVSWRTSLVCLPPLPLSLIFPFSWGGCFISAQLTSLHLSLDLPDFSRGAFPPLLGIWGAVNREWIPPAAVDQRAMRRVKEPFKPANERVT